jgi:hypothetical protein
MRELTETELDAVCGGLFDLSAIIGSLVQTNVQTNTAVNIGLVGLIGGSLTQAIGQSNINGVF